MRGQHTRRIRIARCSRQLVSRSVHQQAVERFPLGRLEIAIDFNEVPVLGVDDRDAIAGSGGRERGVKLGDAERAQCVAPA